MFHPSHSICDQSHDNLGTVDDCSNGVPAEYANEKAVEEVQKLRACVKENLEPSSHKEVDDDALYNFNSITLLENLQKGLIGYNTQFLSDYLNVLISNNGTIISHVSDNIITSIEQLVMRLRDEQRMIPESDMIVLVCWLCAAVIWDSPCMFGARNALHALLPYLTEQETARINQVWQHCASPPACLALSDAVKRAPPESPGALKPGDMLSSLLLVGVESARGEGGLLAVRRRGRQLRAGQDQDVPLSGDNNHMDIQKKHAISKVKQIILD